LVVVVVVFSSWPALSSSVTGVPVTVHELVGGFTEHSAANTGTVVDKVVVPTIASVAANIAIVANILIPFVFALLSFTEFINPIID
jgi:hypothetical protein